MTIEYYRKTSVAVDSLFIDRWSPRAFSGETLTDETLQQLFEAARWSPSGANAQPWRFIYAKQGDEHWEKYVSVLKDRNKLWARRASALILIASRKVRDGENGPEPSRTHTFDSGAAWLAIALQAKLLGLATRAIAGFEKDAARAALQVPNDYELQVFVAVGRRTECAGLPDELCEKEIPTDRLPLSALVSRGHFVFN